ncbi:hypothetical protein GR138_11945 [Shinella kummerowiae]|jgi:hypothetical protein|uniref:Uncharacterized protein n=1 Tax=Shinella kummerowiae TaxID=417745 RepID=A0A6N8SF05_9HYPH|nr:hypothetical protein [Shinella kummerowiae]MXN45906.1 hypothetical protein [Shinella kummerowiae]
MRLITTKDGLTINPEHVVQFTTLRNGQTKILLSTGGEQYVEAYGDDLRDLFIPVVNANPGFQAVFVDRLIDGTFHYQRRSVIAWRLCPGGNYPIFQGYNQDADDYLVMIDPAGGVFDSDHNMWPTLEDWRKEYEAEQSEIAASVAKAA